MAQREAVFPAGRQALYEKHRYSAAVRSGDLLFVSGQVGSRPDGSPEPDFEAQVRLAFANLEATLLAAGCGFDDIVDVTTFYTDPEKQLATAAAVRGEFFKNTPYPSLTGVGVSWLAGFDFEIKVTARIPSRASATVSRRNPSAMWDMASRGWSHISVAEPGRLAFLSGQIAAAPGTKAMPEDIAGQAELATANLAAALKDLDATAQDIVMLRVYVVDATTEAFGQVMTPLRELLGDGRDAQHHDNWRPGALYTGNQSRDRNGGAAPLRRALPVTPIEVVTLTRWAMCAPSAPHSGGFH